MPSASHAVVGKTFGRYELLAPLAMGGTAEIFLARIVGEAGFEKYVVVKRLLEHLQDDREFVDMFLDEARLGARLDHSNIVQTLDLGEVDGRYYIAMEYLAGLSLAQIAGKAQQRVAGGLPVELSLGIVAQAASGLHYAHECRLPDGTPLKIVHRDVSPQNLVVTFEGEVKIVDFGIAHAAQRDAHTKSGFIKGKFAYMAPEQCLGKPLDRRTDIFALGIIAWELVTGRRLFKRDTTYATYQAIVKGEVIAPTQVNPRLDPGIDAVIMPALAYDAANRYQTAEDFAEAIHSFLHRRGKRAARGEVGRFVERVFAAEIDEHASRMGSLMTGIPTGPLMQAWDADEPAIEIIEAEESLSAREPSDPNEEGATLIDPEPAKGLAAALAQARAANAAAEGAPADSPLKTTALRATSSQPVVPPPRLSQQTPTVPPPRKTGAQAAQSPPPASSGRLTGPTDVAAPVIPSTNPYGPPAMPAMPLAPPKPSGPVPVQQPYTSSAPAPVQQPYAQSAPVPVQQPYAPPSHNTPPPLMAPRMPTPQPFATPGQPVDKPAFATGSYGPSSDADRLALERRTQGGAKLWLYPVVFVLAAGFGVGALLLIHHLR